MPGNTGASSKGFRDGPLQSLLRQLQATPAPLHADEAKRRLSLCGRNRMVPESRFAGFIAFLRLFANPLVVILLVASGLSLALGDDIDGLIIIAIALLSVLLNFCVEFRADTPWQSFGRNLPQQPP